MQLSRLRGDPQCAPPLSDPIHLSATATVASNSSAGVNAAALKNPSGGPMEIHQIKWELQIPSASVSFTGAVAGGVIACKLEMGGHALTNGYVPVWNFVRPNSILNEILINTGATAAGQVSVFTWTLPRPLYVPDGVVVTPTLQHRGLYTSSINVRVSFGARTFRSKSGPPKKIYLPYVSSYVSKNFDANADDTDQSTELDLVNPFDQPLRLQRLTGRAQFLNSNKNGSGTIYVDEGYNGSSSGASPGEEMLKLRIFDSNGRPIVRNPTILRSIFPTSTRSWEFDNGAVMDPQSYYRILVNKSAPLAGTSSDPVFCQAFVGAVGWREIGGL